MEDVRAATLLLALLAYLFAAAFRATALWAELLLTALLVGTTRFVARCAVEPGRIAVRCEDAFAPTEETRFFVLVLREREELDFIFEAAPLCGAVLWTATALGIGRMDTAASSTSAQTRQPQVKSASARMED